MQAASETHERQLVQARTQLGHKLRATSQRATEKEVSAFRGALETRLSAARSGRDDALKNFNKLHQKALA